NRLTVATAPSLLHLGSLMGGVRSVDQVAVEERAASLGKRSIKKASKVWALELAIRMMDLTTLEGADTPGKVAALCGKAIRPDPTDHSVPSVAAVCLYPSLIAQAVQHLRGTTVKVASVATAFPSGQTFTTVKVTETREAVAAGADEIDMVIDRGAFLSGGYQKVYDEIVRIKEACGSALRRCSTTSSCSWPERRRAPISRPTISPSISGNHQAIQHSSRRAPVRVRAGAGGDRPRQHRPSLRALHRRQIRGAEVRKVVSDHQPCHRGAAVRGVGGIEGRRRPRGHGGRLSAGVLGAAQAQPARPHYH